MRGLPAIMRPLHMKNIAMSKGRPGGNPNIADYGFKPKEDWRGSCNEKMNLKMPLEMKQAIKNGELKEWQEIARRAIARHLGWDVPDEPVNSDSDK